MIGLLASLGRLGQARLRDAGRRVRVRVALVAGAAITGFMAGGFVLVAITVALAERLGAVTALMVMAGAAFVVMLAFIIALSAQARRDREQAALRAELDSRLLRAAAISMVPGRMPSRPVLGLGLVALGALLVLLRRRGDDDG
jgi:hypothetical protein